MASYVEARLIANYVITWHAHCGQQLTFASIFNKTSGQAGEFRRRASIYVALQAVIRLLLLVRVLLQG